MYGTMVGGIGSMTKTPRILTPGSMYPYAPILFDYIRRAMPMDRSQSLSANETYALAAYLLNLNGLVPTDAVMDSDSLPRVQMPNRDGFLIDDRPDTHAVRCMTDCK
jgi:cytochrome c